MRPPSGYGFTFLDQSWSDKGLCVGVDPEMWFPQKGGSTVRVKRVCARCPVETQCLAWAQATSQRFGIWGGLSTAERDQLRRRGLMRRPLVSGTPARV